MHLLSTTCSGTCFENGFIKRVTTTIVSVSLCSSSHLANVWLGFFWEVTKPDDQDFPETWVWNGHLVIDSKVCKKKVKTFIFHKGKWEVLLPFLIDFGNPIMWKQKALEKNSAAAWRCQFLCLFRKKSELDCPDPINNHHLFFKFSGPFSTCR